MWRSALLDAAADRDTAAGVLRCTSSGTVALDVPDAAEVVAYSSLGVGVQPGIPGGRGRSDEAICSERRPDVETRTDALQIDLYTYICVVRAHACSRSSARLLATLSGHGELGFAAQPSLRADPKQNICACLCVLGVLVAFSPELPAVAVRFAQDHWFTAHPMRQAWIGVGYIPCTYPTQSRLSPPTRGVLHSPRQVLTGMTSTKQPLSPRLDWENPTPVHWALRYGTARMTRMVNQSQPESGPHSQASIRTVAIMVASA